MYLVTIILPVLFVLSLASDPHAVQDGALAADEGKTTDGATLDDDLDHAPGSRDGQHSLVTNGTDGSDRLVIKKDALKEANRSKPTDTARKWSRKQEKRQRKKTNLENGERRLSEDIPAKNKKAKLNKDGEKKNITTKKPKVTTGKNPKTKTKISPNYRAMPQDEDRLCPCKRWIPDWDYSVKNISANGTFDAYVCSENDIPAVSQVVAYLNRVDEGYIGSVTVINCIAHFEGVKNGTYVISASALCPAYTVYNDGGEAICESGSKFSDQFVLFEPPKIPVDVEVSDRLVVKETTDSIKPVLFGVVCGLAAIVILIAVVCGIRKLIKRKRCRNPSLQTQNSVELQISPSSSHQPTHLAKCKECGNSTQQPEGFEILNPSVESQKLTNSCITINFSDGVSLSPREISLQVSPSQGEICHQCLARSPRPDHKTTSNMQTTTFSESVAYNQQSLGICQKPSNTMAQPRRDSAFSPINPQLHGPNFAIGIVNKPEDDVIRGPPVPLPDSLLSPKQCNNERVSAKKPLSLNTDKLKYVETKTFPCVENEHFHSEEEPLSPTENDIVYDSEKDKLVNFEKDTLHDSDEDTKFRKEKYQLVNSGKKTLYSSDKDAIHDTEKESLYVS